MLFNLTAAIFEIIFTSAIVENVTDRTVIWISLSFAKRIKMCSGMLKSCASCVFIGYKG